MKRSILVALVGVLFLASVAPLRGGTAQTAFSGAPTWVYEFFTLDAPGAASTFLNGINNDNQIVGSSIGEVGDPQGFVWTNGVFTPFAVPGASATIPDDLNDSGAIVGSCQGCATFPSGPDNHGFLYANGTYYIGPYERAVGVTIARATGVNNLGNMVGWFQLEAPAPGGGVMFYRFGYFDDQEFSRVIMGGVNDARHFVGTGPFPDGSAGAFFQAGITTARITLPFTTHIPEPTDVNNHDVVVGMYDYDDPPSGTPRRGFVWQNGKSVSVNYPGAFTTEVRGNNDAGIIVGHYGPDAHTSHGFVAVPRSPVTVTINGAPGPATIDRAQPLRVDAAFIAPPEGPLSPAELYVGVVAPYGVFWLDSTGRFVTTASRAYAGPLASFGPSPVINLSSASALPAGNYTWFAIVDDDTNSVPKGTFYDLGQVTIR